MHQDDGYEYECKRERGDAVKRSHAALVALWLLLTVAVSPTFGLDIRGTAATLMQCLTRSGTTLTSACGILMGTNVLGFTGAGTAAAPLVSLVGTDGSVNGLYRTADGTLSFTTGVGGGHRMSLTTSALNMLVDIRSNTDNAVDVGGASNRFRTLFYGTRISSSGFVFANIATVLATNGDMAFCSDCTIANPCAGAGSGALAKRLNGVNVCN